MTEQEERLLAALAGMCEQYLKDGDHLNHMFVGAGEDAIAWLVEYGLVKSEPRGGSWTEAGRRLLNSN